jgi:subtilase family serine protease
MTAGGVSRYAVAAAVACATLVALALVASSQGVSGGSTGKSAFWPLAARPLQAKSLVAPLPTSGCLATIGIHCYSPYQFRKAYALGGLTAAGIDGSGQTIAIVDSFGSPTIAHDLHQFDQTFGVTGATGVPADPAIAQDPNLTIIQPAGPVPPFDPTNGDMVGWAEETTLDVEWAHVVAPKANILLVETPVSETEGVQGFPEIVTAENYVIDNHLANVITQSFGATEETFPNNQAILDLRGANLNAQKNNVTVLGSSGDTGSTDYELNLSDLYPMQVNSWPSSDPLVTSIGGTQMNLDDAGNRLSPDVVWNDGFGAGGGGPSHVFSRPDFQNGVKSIVGDARGTPDISMNAAVDGGVWIYTSFGGVSVGYHIIGGTSAASPEFSGIVAMADQVAGQGLGVINNTLYKTPYGGGIVDVTSGNNDIGPFTNSDGVTYHVPGFDALPGYDLASGLGTVYPPRLVPALAAGGAASTNLADCNTTTSFGAINGNIHVKRGSSCTLSDSSVSGNIAVDAGGTLNLNGVTVGGSVTSAGPVSIVQDSGGAPSIVEGSVNVSNVPAGRGSVICGSTIDASLNVSNNKATTVIGTGQGCAAGNSIGGNVGVNNNKVSGGPSAVIGGNTIGGNVACATNSPAPAGGGNTVSGSESGQCTGF